MSATGTPRRGWRMSPAVKRYHARFFPLMALYVGVLMGVIQLFRKAPPEGVLKYVAAVAPALPMVAVVAVIGLYLAEEADEFLRRQAVISILWGLGFILAATTVWGFLEGFADAPRMPAYYVFPMFCGAMGLSQPVIWWRHR